MDTSAEYVKNSDLVISHAGIGMIIPCKEYGIPLIIFPRRKKYDEHGTDHQTEIAKAIEERGDKNLFFVCEEDQLEAKIAEVLTKKRKACPRSKYGKGQSHQNHSSLYRRST